jgi:putative transposase
VSRLCRVWGGSASGYYAWWGRGPAARAQADAALSERSRGSHTASRQTYGTPRIHAELAARGTRGGRQRVARVRRAGGLAGAHRRRWPSTTARAPAAPPVPAHGRRQFVARAPNERGTAALTAVPTWRGVL